MKNVTAYINNKALLHNLDVIKTHVPNSKIIAVVKANAYGHGLINVAKTLESKVDAFAVARIGEAISLKEHNINKPVVLLEGFYNEDEVKIIAQNGFMTAVHDIEQVQMLQKAKLEGLKVKAFMKIDIGMHRLGANPEDVLNIKTQLENCINVEQPIGLISHLSVADTPSEYDYNNEQINYFLDVAKTFKGDLCLANSAGILNWPLSHTDYVRPGIIMYGISPFEGKVGHDHGLMPVMSLKSSLIAIRHVKKGAKIGYGAAFIAPCDTTIGIVAAGYGDGYPRTAPNGTPVYINGRIVPTAGHVCMDMLFVDLGNDAKDKVGDEAVLWGDELPVEIIAKYCNTIPYELVCRVMPRVDISYFG